MPRVATYPSRPSKLNGPARRRTPPFPPLKVLCPHPGYPWSYRSQTDLNRHLPQHMSPAEREKLMHECTAPGCTFQCLQKSNLNTHFTAKHTDVKPYACADCLYRTADPAPFCRHKSATMHEYVSGSEKRKRKTQVKALFLDAVARSTRHSDDSGPSSGSWSSAPSLLPSMEFPKGINFFVAESDAAPYFPASFDATHFSSNFSPPHVHEPPICCLFELQDVNTPFIGEWSDVVC
ncbi:hypothetical protein C8R47DRAFT_1217583 [Mycena vitilis]|nr:hypothetical protein C8R47DRAFT_1217583 [Mycena vitilis]